MTPIRRTPRTALRDEYELTDAIQILIEDGFPVDIAPVVTSDINLTYPQDLLKANLNLLKHHLYTIQIRSVFIIPNGAKVHNCVIGNNVIIENPISLNFNLILAHSTIKSKDDINYSIVTPDGIH